MFVAARHLVEKTTANPAYLRARARRFRHCADDAGDALIHAELLRLATLYEAMAADAEIELRTSTTDHDECE